MSKIAQLIVDLKKEGINLKLVGSNLELTSNAESIPQHLISIIKENKQSIIDFFKDNVIENNTSSLVLPSEKKEYYVASSQQRRLYFIQEFTNQSTAYNSPFSISLHGKTSIEQIKVIVRALLEKHECLRSSFKIINGNVVQQVHPLYEIDIDTVVKEVDIDHQHSSIPFNLQESPILRVAVQKMESTINLLIETHHIINDGISSAIMEREIKSLIEGKGIERQYLQYRDFSEWITYNADSDVIIQQKDYWLNLFKEPLPELNLFKDSSFRNLDVFEGASCSFTCSETEYVELKALAVKNNCSTFHLMFTIFSVLIHKITLNEKFVIGTVISGRNYPHLDDVVGMFVNLLPILFNVDVESQFLDYIEKNQKLVTKSFDNQDYPFDELINELGMQRKDGTTPLIDIVFALHNQADYSNRIKFDSKEVVYQDDTVSRFNMTLNVAELGDRFVFHWEFSKEFYSKSTILNLVDIFKQLLKNIIRDSNKTIKDISVIPFNQNELIEGFNNFSNTELPDEKLTGLWEKHAKNYPDKIAIIQNNTQLTYSFLEERVINLTNNLQCRGIGQNSLVGIFLEKGIDFYVSILAIIKCGGAYVPIDIDYPKKRVSYIIKDANISLLITENKIIEKYNFTELQDLLLKSRTIIKTESCERIINLDALPIPDRSIINYDRYCKFTGLSMVKNCIVIQATRGCPYQCAYCSKVWPSKHLARSAESIFEEVKKYYEIGFKRFVFIDDIFNLNKKNSTKFFNLLIDNGLKVQLFFPAGLRADILTEEYVDLMVKAGTVNMALALETPSVRLQKLLCKNLYVDKLYNIASYICKNYPNVILELFTMHGFPTETPQEAYQTIEFIKSLKWIHFPYFHILKIYPNTDIENIALESGITQAQINESLNLAWHEIPKTLPFDKSVTMECQTMFLSEYFLLKERLLKVLPYQMKILTEDEIIQKYNNYLPTSINSLKELLDFVEISEDELGGAKCQPEEDYAIENINEKIKSIDAVPTDNKEKDNIEVLLLDLTHYFSTDKRNHYDPLEPPLGLLYIATYLKRELGEQVSVTIKKSNVDFDSFSELNKILSSIQPDFIGIRSISYYRDFTHHTVNLIRQWGYNSIIGVGGPYSTSEYDTMLNDENIDIAFLGEGEVVLTNFVKALIKNNNNLPSYSELKSIRGIAFRDQEIHQSRTKIIMLDEGVEHKVESESPQLKEQDSNGSNIVYIIYTSGSTGNPKGVLVNERNVVNLVNSQSKYFNVSSDERIFQFSSLSFDASVEQIWLAFANGATLVVPDKELLFQKSKLEKYLKNNCVSHIHAVPSFLEEIEMSKIPGLKRIIAGGDLCGVNLARKFYKHCNFYNEYGPTETTVTSSNYHVKSTDYLNIPIGRPVDNTSVLILDKYNNNVPLGFVGELLLGGEGVANGYMNNCELTNDSFIEIDNYKGRFYKTGDIVRFQPDGNIEFLGRKDKQVKIRGYRIELKEIETALLKHELVKQTVVLTVELQDGSSSLCAYVVSEKDVENFSDELKNFLGQSLPAYMVPQYMIKLDNLPKTFSGKIDRKALEKIELIVKEDIIKPQNNVESELLDIWSEVLSIDKEKLSVDVGFFEMGGHSLKAMVLLSNIHKTFGVKIELKDLFDRQTIKNQAEFISASKNNELVNLPKAGVKKHYKLTSSQKRLFLIQNLNVDTTAYNVPQLIKLPDEIKNEDIINLFYELTERHESLRTRFVVVNDEPFQVIKENTFIDLNEIHEKESDLFSSIKKLVKPFDLSQELLFRLFVVKTDKNNRYLFIDAHHIIIDFVSHEILRNEFLKLLRKEELEKAKYQYKDYSEWINTDSERDRILEQEKYWLSIFNDGIPKLNLPVDFPRPLKFTFNGGRVREIIDLSELKDLVNLAKENHLTMNMLMFSVFSILMSKLSDSNKIVIGTPVSARTHPDLNKTVGLFINTLALKFEIDSEKTILEYLHYVKDNILSSLKNQEYPFEDLQDKIAINRELSRNPVFDVMFNYLNVNTNNNENSGNINLSDQLSTTSKFDLTLTVTDLDDRLILDFTYYKGIFKEETIINFKRYFKSILYQLLGAVNKNMSELSIIDEDEKEKLLYDFNRTETHNNHLIDIVEKFNHCVLTLPNKIAVNYSKLHSVNSDKVVSNSLTYKAFDEKSNQLANKLFKVGIQPGDIVGLYFTPSLEMIVSILAILKTGASFLPLNSDLPGKRIDYILNDANVKLVLTGDDDLIYIDKINRIRVSFSELKKYSKEFVYQINPNNHCYIIYTSGTTGKPKGVIVKNSGLINYLNWFQDFAKVVSGDKTSLLTSYSFDLGYTSLFSSILQGAELNLLDTSILSSPFELLNYLSLKEMTYLKMTPSLFSVLAELDGFIDLIKKLRLVVLGGEPIQMDDVVRSIKINKELRFLNHYGPTEATIGCIAYEINEDNIEAYQAKPVIGKPINNTKAFILDKDRNIMPLGYEGMLYISGEGLAEGYLNEQENTFDKFTSKNNFGSGTLYCTGDNAKWLPNGTIEFLGRKDSQVKVNGYRVDLLEIEQCVVDFKDVRDAKVVLKKIGQNIDQLCCFILQNETKETFSSGDLKQYLLEYFPIYMVPSVYKVIEEIPLTPNGKVNVNLLLSMEDEYDNSIQVASNDTEEKLVEIWSQLLNKRKEEISVTRNFFELGGNSLAILKMIKMINDYFQLKLNPVTIFQYPTISELERFMNNNEEIFEEEIEFSNNELDVLNLMED